MKLNILKKGAILLVIAAFMTACGDKKAKQLNYIPKDVSGVIAIDAKKLALKSIDLKDLLNIDLFKKTIPTSADSIVNKVKNSGIDLLNTAYIFGDVAKGDQKNYVAAVFALEDEAKFEKSLKEVAKIPEVKTDNDIKYTFIGRDNIIGWKDKVAIAITIDGETDQEKYKAKLKNLFTQPEENSLAASNDKFKTLLKDEADISVFVNYEKLGDLLKQAGQNSMITSANFKDTYLAATINFENGKIISDMKVYNNEENTKKAKELYKASVSKDLLKAQPGGDVIAFMSFGVNMEAVVKYLKEANLLDGINKSLQELGPEFDANYVAAALSGDVISTLNTINIKEVSVMDYMTGEMKPGKDLEFVYAISVGLKDAAKFQKLLDAIASKGALAKTGNYYSIANRAFLVTKANSIVIVSTEAIAKDASDNKNTPLSEANINLMGSNTMALGIDISKVKPDVLAFIGKEASKISDALPFESIVISAEEVKSEVVTAKTVVSFKNKEQNSFISLQKALQEADKFIPQAPTSYEESADATVIDSSAVIEEVEVP